MFYKKKSDIIFRDYESFGYITDNRNFGYRKLKDNEEVIGDKILSKSGSAFFSILEKRPLSLDDLVKRAHNLYTDVEIELLKNDLQDFYNILEQDGFIVSGKTLTECNEKDIKFSYRNSTNEAPRERLQVTNQKKDTQDFFEDYFNSQPQLTSVHIEITSKCNERCVHCYIPHENKISDMSPDLFSNILNQCISLNVLHITISGGEPMLNKYFCSFLNEVNNHNFSVSVLSNLTLLDDEIITELKANPLLGVQVSLYSMKPNIHDQITKLQGSFEKTKNNILKLVENDIPVQITCPIIIQNKNCYKDVITWAKEHKIDATSDTSIMAKYDHTTTNLYNRLLPNDVKKILHDKISEDPQYLAQLINEAHQKKASNPNDIACSICHSSVCIMESGNVYPCAGWQGCIIGNIKENSLGDIWKKSEKVVYLRSLRKKDFPKCTSCSVKEFCTMCMVRNANENQEGNPLVVNEYFCDIARITKELALEHQETNSKEID